MRARPRRRSAIRSAIAAATAASVALSLATVVGGSSLAHGESAPATTRSGLSATSAVEGRFNPVDPVVVRASDGRALPGRMLAGTTKVVRVVDGYGVPAVEVGAVVVQLSARDASRRGSLRVAAPSRLSTAADALQLTPGDIAQNQLVVPLTSSGTLAIRTTVNATVGLTIVGWLDTTTARPDLSVLPSPVRALDSRRGPHASAARDLVVDLHRETGVPDSAAAALVNLTVLRPTASGYLGVRPAGTPRTQDAAVTATRGRDTAHLVVVPLDAGSSTALRLLRGTADVVVDVVGYVPGPSTSGDATSGIAVAARSTRVVDTRTSSRYAAGRDLNLVVAGRHGVPAEATSVTAVVTAVGGSEAGRATVAPRTAVGAWTPLTVEAGRRVNRSLLVTLPLGPTGQLTLRRTSRTHAVVDVVAWTLPAPLVVRAPDVDLIAEPVDVPTETPTETPTDSPAGRRATSSQEQRRLAAQVLSTSSRYALGTWWDDVLPRLRTVPLGYISPRAVSRGSARAVSREAQTAAYERSVRNDLRADPVRRIANVAFGLAANLASDTWDEQRIGFSREEATGRLVALIDYAVRGHLSQQVGGWGKALQGSLNAGYLGRAAWLVWDDLPVATQRAAAEMIAAEADDIIGRGELYYRDRAGTVVVRRGDSKAEESSWQALPVQLALAMFPESDHRGAWSYAATRSALSSWARHGDVERTDVVQGRPLRAWLQGSNVEDDGTVLNHSRIAPDYMALVYQTLDQAWLQSLVGEPTPQAARELVGPVVRAFTAVTFSPRRYDAPGGTIYTPDSATLYYPQGVDWGTGMQLVYALMDTEAYALDVGVAADSTAAATAQRYSLLHLRAAAAMQARFADGRTYCGTHAVGCTPGSRTEFQYVGREELVGQLAAQLVLTLDVADAGLVSFSNEPWSTF